MRRRIIPLAALLIMALTISAQAIDLRAISVVPSLSFNGTTAVCYVDCWTGNSQDKVTATLTLYQDSAYVDSWNNSGKGGVFVSGSCEVESGKSYKLVLSYLILSISVDTFNSKICGTYAAASRAAKNL